MAAVILQGGDQFRDYLVSVWVVKAHGVDEEYLPIIKSNDNLLVFAGVSGGGGLVGSGASGGSGCLLWFGCPFGSGDLSWSPNILDISPQFTIECVKYKN